MTTKTTPSCSTLKTLNGLFEVPRMNHRRDFLRENKLSLKELQRNTSQKILQGKQEQEKRQQFQLQNHKKQRERFVAKRSASQHRGEVQDYGRHRSFSQQREPQRQYLATNKAVGCNQCCKKCSCSGPLQQAASDTRVRVPRSASAASGISKAESCDKEIQTEDINDEEFLYEALKKCSSTDLKRNYSNQQRSTGNYTNHHQMDGDRISQSEYNNHNNIVQHDQHEDTKSHLSDLPHETNSRYNLHNADTKSQHSNQTADTRSQHSFQPADTRSQHNLKTHDNISQCSLRTQCSQIQANGHLRKPSHTHNRIQEQDNHHLEEDMQNLNIDHNNMIMEPEVHCSARSRQTINSQISKKKSNGSIHKLGSRDDIRLPRYLEKEKREKEVERVKELSRDPNCPYDHYVLPEDERASALNMAQKKMATLIQELNHMPMTSETLRIRNRKVEIEKELTKIEADIRLFSKPKVYVPLPTGQY